MIWYKSVKPYRWNHKSIIFVIIIGTRWFIWSVVISTLLITKVRYINNMSLSLFQRECKTYSPTIRVGWDIAISTPKEPALNERSLFTFGDTSTVPVVSPSYSGPCNESLKFEFLQRETPIYKWLLQLDDSKSFREKWLFNQTSI